MIVARLFNYDERSNRPNNPQPKQPAQFLIIIKIIIKTTVHRTLQREKTVQKRPLSRNTNYYSNKCGFIQFSRWEKRTRKSAHRLRLNLFSIAAWRLLCLSLVSIVHVFICGATKKDVVGPFVFLSLSFWFACGVCTVHLRTVIRIELGASFN